MYDTMISVNFIKKINICFISKLELISVKSQKTFLLQFIFLFTAKIGWKEKNKKKTKQIFAKAKTETLVVLIKPKSLARQKSSIENGHEEEYNTWLCWFLFIFFRETHGPFAKVTFESDGFPDEGK